MNPMVQRYLPPVLVMGAGLFFAWPPSPPLDLGDDVVRAKSVRWRASDLADPPWIEPTVDPFREVLVAAEATEEKLQQEVVPVPTGPGPEQLKAGLRLDGIANMGGRKWAVLNGRPRLPGDIVRTADAHRNECEILSVEADHIVVRCLETVTEIRTRPNGSARPVAVTTPSSSTTSAAVEATTQFSGDPPPPPQG